jgi:predicted dithiol-disulfide oxidoreductase (DUF899 family)
METTTNIEQEIAHLENEIIEKNNRLTELRKQRSRVKVTDYIFKNSEGREIKLSEMFGTAKELMLVHNMGKSCPYCTLWADEYNGVIQHLENRVPFVVVSPDEPAVMREFAEGRNWKFRMYSSKENSFKKDMGFENEKGSPMPGVSVFTKDDDGTIWHVNKAGFGPGDNFCGVWHYFDLLPGGAGKWHPKYSY